MIANFGEDFLPGVYRTTGGLAALVLLALLGTLDWRLIAGFILGVGISVGLLRVLEWSVRTAFRPEATGRQRAAAAGITGAKYLLVGFVFWFCLTRKLVDPRSLFGGLLLPQLVIFLQAVGQVIAERGRSSGCVPTNE